MASASAEIALRDACQANRPKPTFAQPTQIGSFAIHNGVYYNGGKEHLVRVLPLLISCFLAVLTVSFSFLKRRYCEPKLPCNLNEGFEQRVAKQLDSDGDMGPILRNIRDNNLDVRFC